MRTTIVLLLCLAVSSYAWKFLQQEDFVKRNGINNAPRKLQTGYDDFLDYVGEHIDTNDSESINEKEFTAWAKKWEKVVDDTFKKLDANKDGQLSIEEFTEKVKEAGYDDFLKYLESHHDDLWGDIDTNGDGHLTKAEIKAFVKANLPPIPEIWEGLAGHFDTNGDGEITKEEFENTISDERGGKGKKGGKGKGKKPTKGGKGGRGGKKM